jgi:hypothetical protein
MPIGRKASKAKRGCPAEATGRAVEEYLAVLDDAAFGAATEVTPKFISPADPAARWTGAHGGQAFFGYSTNHPIDAENATTLLLAGRRGPNPTPVLAGLLLVAIACTSPSPIW